MPAMCGVLALVAFCGLLLWACTPVSGGSLSLDMRVTLEQDDREILEGYTATYNHSAITTLRGRRTRNTEVRNAKWDGYETCDDPPLELKWQSLIIFDDFPYAEPEVGVVVRDTEAWLLYHPAREFGVKHPGRPPCGPGDGIPPGTLVPKSYFFDDLAEGAEPAGDFPVYFEDESDSWGGFVLAVLPMNELEAGRSIPLSVSYELVTGIFTIRFRIEGTITPIP
ncbi:MAG: hypothetical protein O7C75_00885 [Verrucomicrobia bacterium]|nr:hypothetical protein [Verrucomicrobiota bacterium]